MSRVEIYEVLIDEMDGFCCREQRGQGAVAAGTKTGHKPGGQDPALVRPNTCRSRA